MKKTLFYMSIFLTMNLYADLILNGNKEYRDGFYKEAIQSYKKACEIGNGEGCKNVATMYIKGHGVNQDVNKVVEYTTKSCDFNQADGCYDLAYFYYRGVYVKQDKSKAREYFNRSCNLGHHKGCKNYKKLTNSGVN